MRSLDVLNLSDPDFSVTLGSEPHLEVLNKYRNNTSIAHINVQSLTSTFDEFSYMLNQYYFDIVALSETWLTGNKHQLDYVKIDGYKSLFKNREHKRGGGVGFYVKENISFTERKDLSNIEKSIESLWIEVCGRNKNTPYLVGVIYQPNFNESDKQDWLEKFDHLLTEIYVKWHGVLILTGDFNIDLLGCDKESTRRYKDILHSFSLQQHITKPTRKSKTIIDHICSNIAKRVVHEDVVLTDEISDHDTPYVVFNIKKELFEPRYKFIRNEKNLDMNRYINDFQQLPLSLVYSFDDPEDQINILNKLIADCINEHSPLRRVKLTRPIAPWMNDPKITVKTEHLIDTNTSETRGGSSLLVLLSQEFNDEVIKLHARRACESTPKVALIQLGVWGALGANANLEVLSSKTPFLMSINQIKNLSN